MPKVLRFGISSLDELLGIHPDLSSNKQSDKQSNSNKQSDEENFGIYLPLEERDGGKKLFTTSVCIVGPSGTGKSIFGLHMASKYLADCGAYDKKLPAVLYVSTDFTFKMAERVWKDFALNYPFSRKDPFRSSIPPRGLGPDWEITLKPCHPVQLAEDFDAVIGGGQGEERQRVVFLDMASHTAGDDWGFLYKLLSLMPMPGVNDPRHMVVIDAIEGFEALGGELNAFGEKSTRRSRVAQVMRLIAEKCHALIVIEESQSNKKLAEEFVADTVISLESLTTRNYERRVLKVEKVRGQSHIRGQHHYSIRSGNGSTTGSQDNPDDPAVLFSLRPDFGSPPISPPDRGGKVRQCYIQVFQSVHRLNRKIMEVRGEGRRKPDNRYAAFGIQYLDNMLGGKDEKVPDGLYDTRGLPCCSTTALIGDSLTQKSTLGKAFLSRCFSSFSERLGELLRQMDSNKISKTAELVRPLVLRKLELLFNSTDELPKGWESPIESMVDNGDWAGLSEYLNRIVHPPQTPPTMFDSEGKPLSNEERLTHLAAWLLDYELGVAVMIVTHNVHNEKLAEEFCAWRHTAQELAELKHKMPGYETAYKNYIKGGTICRRLEIHSLSSEVLVHVVLQVIRAAQRKILTLKDMQDDKIRFERSWPIRVVIDDLTTLRDIFPELHEDPLLLPTILFHFEREGVTTLILDTQAGKPETPIAERFESELRQMVQHHLYTWRVPFYGESRVAITAIPPLSYEYAGIVRELRWESESRSNRVPTLGEEPATVDPHLELYTGLEESNPRPIPLRILFYAETPAMTAYIEAENRFLGELFVPPVADSPHADTGSVITAFPSTNYNELRDFAYLQRDTRLDYALVFQVDEFWAMRTPSRRKRAGAFHPQGQYLNAATATVTKSGNALKPNYEPDPNVDPYELFQPRGAGDMPAATSGGPAQGEPICRLDFYHKYYEDFLEPPNAPNADKKLIDRIPFTWDFGFLLCPESAWKSSRAFDIGDKTYTIEAIWDNLVKAKDEYAPDSKAGDKKTPAYHVSWRMFIEACKKAAERQSDKLSKPVTAFDFAQISPESFSCLVLEMWFSEIYEFLNKKDPPPKLVAERERFLGAVTKRHQFTPQPGDNSERSAVSLYELVEKYWLEMYKAWLLLIEVLNFSDIVGEATAFNFDFKSKNTDFSAIASRHWYKTASQCPDEIAGKQPLVAVRLPGRFSVRGDWFLAVSGSSRSIRQAERALDLLNSRRANVTRLQMGIGLPTRVANEESVGKLRTKLISHEFGKDNVAYETFLNIAAKPQAADGQEFYWLWRSGLFDYAHSNRIWHKWLNRTLLSWYRKLLRYRSVWRNSFSIYDELTGWQERDEQPKTPEAFAPTQTEILAKERCFFKRDVSEDEKRKLREDHKTYLKRFKVKSLAQLKVRRSFLDLWEELKAELEQSYARQAGESDEQSSPPRF